MRVEGRPLGRAGLPPLPPPRPPPPRPPGSLEPRRALLCEGREGKDLPEGGMGARRRRVNQALARGEGAGAGGPEGPGLPGEREALGARGRALPGERARAAGETAPGLLPALLLLVGLALLVLWVAHR